MSGPTTSLDHDFLQRLRAIHNATNALVHDVVEAHLGAHPDRFNVTFTRNDVVGWFDGGSLCVGVVDFVQDDGTVCIHVGGWLGRFAQFEPRALFHFELRRKQTGAEP